jgi:hypothetical protein
MRGLGGIGKSSLALQYAHRAWEAGAHAIVWWVRANSPVTLETDFVALSDALGMAVPTDGQDVVQLLRSALSGREDWLIVYDNAERPADLARALPSGGGHVLITSRKRNWTSLAAPIDNQPCPLPGPVPAGVRAAARVRARSRRVPAQRRDHLAVARRTASTRLPRRAR